MQIDNSMARCLGLSLEEFLQRWDRTNFSGARAGKLTVWRHIEAQRANSVWDFLQRLYCLLVEDLILQGYITLPGTTSALEGWLLFLERREEIVCASWFGSPKDEIDRAKTADAYLAEKELGVATLERYCNEILGVDWEENLEQIIYEVKRRYDLLFECGIVDRIDNEEIKRVIELKLDGQPTGIARQQLRDGGALEEES